MAGFLGKIFGSKKKKPEGLEGIVEALLAEVITLAAWDLKMDMFRDDVNDLNVNFSGGDEELLLSKEGQLLSVPLSLKAGELIPEPHYIFSLYLPR